MITCGGCPKTWTGLTIAHCGACHETFSSITHFDAHRSQYGQRGRCLDPKGLTRTRRGEDTGEPLLRLNKHDVWVGVDTYRGVS